jgi:hypothetical protein
MASTNSHIRISADIDLNAAVYRVALTPDASLEVEASGNVVLTTPERRITITDIERWRDELAIARQTARALDV